MAKVKTQFSSNSVETFINNLENDQKKKDSFRLIELMEKATHEKPKMWGSSIIGFGNKRYKSPTSGREVDWFKIGFSPRKTNLTVYLINMQLHADALKRLGKYKAGGGCLYIKKLKDIDMKVLEGMITETLKTK